ncbi:MAG: hypothetical protein K2Y39_06700 [Candidatus Obscuribacterales bacterium]|nr:hypothetical protein [Candidatus Obscuribacterales bacterium]
MILTSPSRKTKTESKRHFAGFAFFRGVNRCLSERKVISLALSLQVVFSAALPLAAFSYTPEITAEETQVEKLTNEIFHKLVDLERYYLQYRKIGTATPKFRRVRYFLAQVAATSCTMASNIMLTDVARKGLKDNKITNFGRGDGDVDPPDTSVPSPSVDNTNGEVRRAIVLAMIGTVLGPGSSLMELCSNGYTAAKNIKQGKNPATAVKAVQGRLAEIDALLSERRNLLDAHPELRALPINKAEHVVLQCFRDWCLSEFVEIYSDVKSGQSGANVYYALDATNGGLSLTGQILGLKSTYPNYDRLAGPSATVSVVGDCFSLISAPASAFAGKKLKNYWKKKAQSTFKEHLKFGETEAKASMEQLRRIVDNADPNIIASSCDVESRMAAYMMWSARYDDIINREEIELSHRGKVAHQGQRIGPLIAGSGLAQDLLADIAFYGYPNNERRGASLAYSGSISAVSGNATALAYSNYNFISEYLYRRKLRRQRLLPQQLLDERLRLLDQVDLMLPKRDQK